MGLIGPLRSIPFAARLVSAIPNATTSKVASRAAETQKCVSITCSACGRMLKVASSQEPSTTIAKVPKTKHLKPTTLATSTYLCRIFMWMEIRLAIQSKTVRFSVKLPAMTSSAFWTQKVSPTPTSKAKTLAHCSTQSSKALRKEVDRLLQSAVPLHRHGLKTEVSYLGFKVKKSRALLI